MDAFSTPRNRTFSFMLLGIGGVSAIAAAALGIDDNPPGALLAYLAALCFVLAFVHPWRTVSRFGVLLGASVLGIVLFIALDIASNSIAQNPATSSWLLDLMESRAYDALIVAFTMLILATLLVGAVGTVAMFIRSRRRPM